MEKMFAEVFPPLPVEQGLADLLEQVRVEKVTSNRAKNNIRVYLVSKKLIHKEQLFQLERLLKRQLFGNSPVEVKILERFELSEQYTPGKVLELYRDSLLFELREYNILEYNLFRGARISFPEEGLMKLVLEKTTLGEEAADELIRILYKVFTERCGMDLRIQTEFVQKSREKEKGRADVEKQAEALIETMLQAMQDSQAEGDREEKPKKPAETGKTSPERKAPRPNFGKEDYPYRKTLRSGGRTRANHPDVIYGRDFEDTEITDLSQIVGEMGEVVIHGQVTAVDEREIRGEKTIVTITVTDYTDTIRAKFFAKNEEMEAFREQIKKGVFVKIKGMTAIDRFDNELAVSSLTGIKKSSDFRTPRTDKSQVKRVELHCHTKMSDMDGVSEVKDLIKRAKAWGHKAIAVTDHGVVQAYPDASHCLDKGDPFKVIYGLEGYLVDDL